MPADFDITVQALKWYFKVPFQSILYDSKNSKCNFSISFRLSDISTTLWQLLDVYFSDDFLSSSKIKLKTQKIVWSWTCRASAWNTAPISAENTHTSLFISSQKHLGTQHVPQSPKWPSGMYSQTHEWEATVKYQPLTSATWIHALLWKSHRKNVKKLQG